MQVKFLGCGDAFGSGGRLNTCFLVNRGDASFLIDCGASAMISIRRFGVDPTFADAILDRLVHNAHRLALDGPSMRDPKTAKSDTTAPGPSAANTTVTKPPTGAKNEQRALRPAHARRCV